MSGQQGLGASANSPSTIFPNLTHPCNNTVAPVSCITSFRPLVTDTTQHVLPTRVAVTVIYSLVYTAFILSCPFNSMSWHGTALTGFYRMLGFLPKFP